MSVDDRRGLGLNLDRFRLGPLLARRLIAPPAAIAAAVARISLPARLAIVAALVAALWGAFAALLRRAFATLLRRAFATLLRRALATLRRRAFATLLGWAVAALLAIAAAATTAAPTPTATARTIFLGRRAKFNGDLCL